MQHKETILIVDDDSLNLKMFSKALFDAGYKILTAQSFNETIKILKNYTPDLVLLDIMLGSESGLDILKEIKTNYTHAYIFVVLISGVKISSDEQSLGLELGADGYLTKPIPNRELIAWVRSFIRHKNTLDKLVDSEHKFRSMAENSPIAISIIDLTEEHKHLYVNKQWEKISGYSNDEAYKLSPFDYAHPDDQDKLDVYFSLLLKEDNLPDKNELNIITKSGLNKCVEFSAIVIDFENTKAILVTAADITEKKTIEVELHQQRDLYESIVSTVPVMIVHYDTSYKAIFQNKESEKLLGWTSDELPEINLIEKIFTGKDQRESALNYLKRIGSSWKEFIVTSKTGNKIASEWSYIKLSDESIIGVGIDVSSVREASEKIKKYIQELKKQNSFMVNRELKMVELKKEVNELCRALSKPLKYTTTDIGKVH